MAVDPIVFPDANAIPDGFLDTLNAMLSAIIVPPTQLRACGLRSVAFAGKEAPTLDEEAVFVSLGKREWGSVAFPPKTLSSLAEIAMGGAGGTGYSRRTPTQSLMARSVARPIADAVAKVLGLRSPELDAVEPTIARTLRFALEFDAGAVGPLAATLLLCERTLADLAHKRPGADGPSIGGVLGSIRVTVRAILAQPAVSVRELAALRIGSVIAIPARDDASLVAEGLRLGRGTIEDVGGRTAVRLAYEGE